MEEEPEAAKLQVPRLLLNGFELHCWLRMLDATSSCLKLQESCAVDDLDVDSSDLDDELIEALEEVLAGPPPMHFSPIAMSTRDTFTTHELVAKQSMSMRSSSTSRGPLAEACDTCG